MRHAPGPATTAGSSHPPARCWGPRFVQGLPIHRGRPGAAGDVPVECPGAARGTDRKTRLRKRHTWVAHRRPTSRPATAGRLRANSASVPDTYVTLPPARSLVTRGLVGVGVVPVPEGSSSLLAQDVGATAVVRPTCRRSAATPVTGTMVLDGTGCCVDLWIVSVESGTGRALVDVDDIASGLGPGRVEGAPSFFVVRAATALVATVTTASDRLVFEPVTSAKRRCVCRRGPRRVDVMAGA